MLIYSLQCDRCGIVYPGVPGEYGHHIRQRAKKDGWAQGKKTPAGIVLRPDGAVDVCPACVGKVNAKGLKNE